MEIIFSSFDYDFCLICSRPLLQLFQFWAHINVGGGGGELGGGLSQLNLNILPFSFHTSET